MNKPGFLRALPCRSSKQAVAEKSTTDFLNDREKITDEGFIEGSPWRDPTIFL
jgi:hypothetical protein